MSREFGEGDLIANRYRLERHLGRGGMGTVWLATDAELDDLPVAVKMIRPELAGDAQFIAGLKAEAKSSLALTHPHIVRVFNLHRDDANPDLTFLVLKYIEGETMKQLLAGSPQGLAPERVLKWADQIASALDYAHSMGVLHRDIKPSNVMIEASSDTAYLMDFGICCQLGATMVNTGTGSSVGTPAYMSPQKLHEKDCISNDIYSFAATLYEALCGRPPFGGANIEEQILRVHAKPIPGIDEKVNEGLLAGLAKAEEDRPNTAAELVEWMTNGVPGAQQEASVPERVGSPLPSARTAASEARSELPIGAVAAGLVLVGGFAVGRTPRIAMPIRNLLGMQASSAQSGLIVPPPNPVIPPDGFHQGEPKLGPIPATAPLVPQPEPIEWTRDDAPRFIQLVREGKTDTVREALDAAATSGTVVELLEVLDPQTGYAALHEAASLGKDELVRMLADAGAQIDQPGLMGLTPLHVATRSKRHSTVQLLLKLGASVNATTLSGDTPLHFAAENAMNASDLLLIQALLDSGADRSLLNNKGQTAADRVKRTCKVRDEVLAKLKD